MADQFMAGMQRHFDMLAFNLASRENATEEAYNRHVRAPRVMPAPAAHRNFEQMQAASRDLLFCQIVNDTLNLAVNCLNNVHLFLALVKARADHGDLSPEAQQSAQTAQREFVQAPLDKKFNELEADYGIMCETEDTILALVQVIQALVQQGGIVQAAHVDEQGELCLELKTAAGANLPAGGIQSPRDLPTEVRTFREGDRIRFSDQELQNLLLTITAFAHQIFTAAFAYARDNSPGTSS